MNQKPVIGIGIAAITAALCFITLASGSARIEKSATVDAGRYADFIENEVFDIQDLAEDAETHYLFSSQERLSCSQFGPLPKGLARLLRV